MVAWKDTPRRAPGRVRGGSGARSPGVDPMRVREDELIVVTQLKTQDHG